MREEFSNSYFTVSEAVLAYSKLGWKIFPIWEGTKVGPT